MSTANDPRIEEAQKILQDGIAALVEGSDWTRYLEAQAKFHNYSMSNTFWLMGQASARGVGISQFAGYNTWKALGRQVRKGEKAFQVLAPLRFKRKVEKNGVEENVYGIRGFRVAPTFDISQTDGPELPKIVTHLDEHSDTIQDLYAAVVKFSTDRGVNVAREFTGNMNGYYSMDGSITVNIAISGLQALKTLVHEVAHSILHTNIADHHSKAHMEVEAESTAFVVLNALGFDTKSYSFGYVAGWSNGDIKIVKEVAEKVQRTAKMILNALKVTQDQAEEELAA